MSTNITALDKALVPLHPRQWPQLFEKNQSVFAFCLHLNIRCTLVPPSEAVGGLYGELAKALLFWEGTYALGDGEAEAAVAVLGGGL